MSPMFSREAPDAPTGHVSDGRMRRLLALIISSFKQLQLAPESRRNTIGSSGACSGQKRIDMKGSVVAVEIFEM